MVEAMLYHVLLFDKYPSTLGTLP